jgi:PEGA domain
MLKKLAIIFSVTSTGLLWAQAPTPTTTAPTEKPRIFITDSQSWEVEGGAGGSGSSFGAASSGGARPQTAEIIKTFGEKCPAVTVNNMREKANYIVVLDHEGGKGALRHKNKVAVFDSHSGDSIVSKSTLSLGGSVDEACRGIEKHWAEHQPASASLVDSVAKPEEGARLQPAVATTSVSEPVAATSGATLTISSTPDGADIEIDGAFMGSAPSSLQLQPGDHKIVVKKNGYKPWERTLKVAGGKVSIKAELEKN